jgi:hypothetical protein
MANPAFQMIEAKFPGSGAFGEDAFGESVFGGSMWPPVVMPRVQLGSNDLAQSLREFISEIRLERYGHTVASRKYAIARLWDVTYSAINLDAMELMRPFFRIRNFWLLPDGNDQQNKIPVRWVGTEFDPDYVSPGVYALKFQLEERI